MSHTKQGFIMGFALIRYEAARKALAEAYHFDDVKDIRDQAVAMQAYAKEAKDPELIEYATEIRKRAERKAGQRLEEMAEKGERKVSGKGGDPGCADQPGLKNFGVTKDQSHNWQKLGALSDDDFEGVTENAKKYASSQLIQQSLSNEHYTPKKYIIAARSVMGTIDLDPASCEKANKIVNATQFFSSENNGLKHNWSGNIWLNPPYGGKTASFIDKLISEIQKGNILQAIVLVNAHCTDTKWFQPLFDAYLCFTNHRINFYGDEERSGSTHGSVFAYFGDNKNVFVDKFSTFGPVVSRIYK